MTKNNRVCKPFSNYDVYLLYIDIKFDADIKTYVSYRHCCPDMLPVRHTEHNHSEISALEDNANYDDVDIRTKIFYF